LELHSLINVFQLFDISEEENYEGSILPNSLSMNSDSYLSVIQVVDEARQVVFTNLIEEENIVFALDDDIDEVRHSSSFLALKSK
jgi:hypothetical protein